MQTIKLRSKIGKDGILHLDIPVGVTETELEVTLMFESETLPSQGKGYPPDFFENRSYALTNASKYVGN